MLLVPSMNSLIQIKLFVDVLSKKETWSWAIVSLDGFPLGNIFARQQSIVGPISNSKKQALWFSLQYCSYWSTVHSSIVLVGLGRLASRYFCLCRVDHHSVWSRMCLPVIGNSSLVNLNVLNYIYNEAIFRVNNGYSHVSHALDC